jgi:hypothetical protein
MRLIALVLLLLYVGPAKAEVQFPVQIPQECFELAHREGVPTLIQNRYQATKAKLKLAHLSSRDPLVRECRAAVERAKQAAALPTPGLTPAVP